MNLNNTILLQGITYRGIEIPEVKIERRATTILQEGTECPASYIVEHLLREELIWRQELLKFLGGEELNSIPISRPPIKRALNLPKVVPIDRFGSVLQLLGLDASLFQAVVTEGFELCKRCGGKISNPTAEEFYETVIKDLSGQLVAVVAPLRPGWSEDRVQRAGFERFLVNGSPLSFGESLKDLVEKQIEVVIDRVSANDSNRRRLLSAINTALKFGAGSLNLLSVPGSEKSEYIRLRSYNINPHCSSCGLVVDKFTLEEFKSSLATGDVTNVRDLYLGSTSVRHLLTQSLESLLKILTSYSNSDSHHELLECLDQLAMSQLPSLTKLEHLSVGDQNRLILSRLASSAEPDTCYTLIEPSYGLSREDLKRLLCKIESRKATLVMFDASFGESADSNCMDTQVAELIPAVICDANREIKKTKVISSLKERGKRVFSSFLSDLQLTGTVAGALGMLPPLADLFASLPISKVRGVSRKDFLNSISKGKDTVSDIRFKDCSLGELMNLTLDEAEKIVGNIPKLRKIFSTVREFGISHLQGGFKVEGITFGERRLLTLARDIGTFRPEVTYIVEAPYFGLTATQRRAIRSSFKGAKKAGAEIIYLE